MNILISNDDGYFSAGITALAHALAQTHQIIVVAPERDRSGASQSLTLDRPLSVTRAPNGFFYVNGTPSDCVHLAVTGLLDVLPDLVISGINHGANMGDDTLYSGTVAAATEGFLLGIPSIACSIVAHDPHHFSTATRIIERCITRFIRPHIPPMLLNINIPDLPDEHIKGISLTRLGKRHHAEPVIKTKSPRGEPIYWIGPAGRAQDAGEGTDFYAIEHNFVSVTPLHIDLTSYTHLDILRASS